jgi:hypothetical protein
MSQGRCDLNGAENYGDKLYQEGLLHRKQKVELLEEIRVQEAEKELRAEGLTFQPAITKHAAAKTSRVFDDYAQHTLTPKQELELAQLKTELGLDEQLPLSGVLPAAEHRLGMDGAGASKTRLLAVWRTIAELRECTFRPFTSAASEELARGRRRQRQARTGIHSFLVAEGKERLRTQHGEGRTSLARVSPVERPPI